MVSMTNREPTTSPIRVLLLADDPAEIHVHYSRIQRGFIPLYSRHLQKIANRTTPVQQMYVIAGTIKKSDYNLLKTDP